MNQPRFVDVDTLQEQTSLEEAAGKCGFALDAHGTGKEVRVDCLFGCLGDHAGKREISINTGNPQKIFCCHAYGCQFRGNLLTLMHGMLTGEKPTGNKLTGGEFTRVRKILAGDVESVPATMSALSSPVAALETPLRNIPLEESDNQKTRDLVTLHERLITDVSEMPPQASAYVRRHRCLLNGELLRKWSVGVLPTGGEDKRGWSLRGHIVFPILSEEGKLLAWIGRDPSFEAKERDFLALAPDQRQREKPPHKHKVPSGFHRGLELFGQHASRLSEPGYRETVAHCGPIIVEGFNDVLALDMLGIPAVAIMSNKITTEQVDKIERWSRQLAQGRVSLLFDTDDPGDEGAKEALWLLTERRLDIRLGWTRSSHGRAFANRQPEQLLREDWEQWISKRLWRE